MGTEMKEEKEDILEPEITPEMIEAGAEVIRDREDELTSWGLARGVYIAMYRLRIENVDSHEVGICKP
jgi:hypothetical protein